MKRTHLEKALEIVQRCILLSRNMDRVRECCLIYQHAAYGQHASLKKLCTADDVDAVLEAVLPLWTDPKPRRKK